LEDCDRQDGRGALQVTFDLLQHALHLELDVVEAAARPHVDGVHQEALHREDLRADGAIGDLALLTQNVNAKITKQTVNGHLVA
jgi:hypothetical protein